MKIICRNFLYKVIEPSNQSRMITDWNDGGPIEKFKAFNRVTVPLGTSDTEITNRYHEITKARVAKLEALKKQDKETVEEPIEE